MHGSEARLGEAAGEAPAGGAPQDTRDARYRSSLLLVRVNPRPTLQFLALPASLSRLSVRTGYGLSLAYGHHVPPRL